VVSIELFGIVVPIAVALVAILLVAIAAGTVGSLLGLGGGLFLVPALVVFFHADFHLVVATSLVSVIATSSGAASAQMEGGFTNLRLAMFLETATSAGGLAGAVVSVTLLANHSNVLIALFVPVVVVAGISMYLRRGVDSRDDVPADRWAERFRLSGEEPDASGGPSHAYRTIGTRPGLAFAGLAGVASGLLGIGGGLFKVPAMNAVMNVPIRVAGATSTFMIGVTATASAIVYLFAGDVVLFLTVPAAIGTLIGSRVGSALRPRASAPWLKEMFALMLGIAAASMIAQLFGALP
jgi:uncharacterized membrane protein YfcA